MRLSTSATTLLNLILLFSTTKAQGNADPSYPTDPTTRARRALTAIEKWYSADTGLYTTAGWWNNANLMTTMGNLAKADPSLKMQAAGFFSTTARQTPAMNPSPGNGKVGRSKRSRIEIPSRRSMEYSKSINEQGDYVTTYPEGWNEGGSAYMDVGMIGSKNGDDPSAGTGQSSNATEWLNGIYDDELWWALAWANAYDVTGNSAYLDLAAGIFEAVTKIWDTPSTGCHGGIWWTYQHTYVNAIANTLFLSTAAHLANRVADNDKKQEYIGWAQKELDWFLNSGMINGKDLVNDGLDNCKNNGKETWSYNQGVLIGGLVELHRASPNQDHIDLATSVAKAAIANLTVNGILHERINNANPGNDAPQFKGIFVRNLQMLHEVAPEQAYVDFIHTNANSTWEKNRGLNDDRMGVEWAGGFEASRTAASQGSALDLLVAAVVMQ